jgi:hypothetical protein
MSQETPQAERDTRSGHGEWDTARHLVGEKVGRAYALAVVSCVGLETDEDKSRKPAAKQIAGVGEGRKSPRENQWEGTKKQASVPDPHR